MTNPDNTVGTNAGYDGRTTPNAFNDILGAFTRGLVSGWACTPKSGMTVKLGGDGSTRDVAIAEDNAGNKTTINNRTATPVEITLAGAPATGNRIDSIVAYVDSGQSGQGATDVDFPSITGIIAVSGTAAGTPTAPTEAQIRSAITNDGADGAGSFYVVLANITVGQGVTTIGSGVISAGTPAQMSGANIANASVGADKLNYTTMSAYGRSTTSLALTTTNQNALTVSLANFKSSDILEVTVTAAATGTNDGNGLIIAFGGVEFIQVASWGRTLTATEYFTKAELGSALTIAARKDAAYPLTLVRLAAIVRKID